MGDKASCKSCYSANQTELYDNLGISGTTYEIGFAAAAEMLGSLGDKRVLDFGCGSGRSSRFLKALGAKQVVGVDRDQNMLAVALAAPVAGIEYLRMATSIPLPDQSVDSSLSACVFVEIGSRSELEQTCAEIARVTRSGGSFVLLSTNPKAFAHEFRTFRYGHTGPLVAGQRYACTIQSRTGSFVIADTYWETEDYCRSMEIAGLDVRTIAYPSPARPELWSTDEAIVAPFVLINATRSDTVGKHQAYQPVELSLAPRREFL